MSRTFRAHTYTHPILGPLTGRQTTNTSGHDVVQFRSLPYATIPTRFAQALPLPHLPPNTSRDFTQYGAACPQRGGMRPDWRDSYGGRLPGEADIKFNEFDCLNLSISSPLAALNGEEKGKLPVMVYIHGGGLSEGVGHVDGLHEGVRLAGFAAEEGMPVIIVNIGYRLNWFGFLASSDLLDASSASAEVEEDAFNMGFYDQRKAFQWLHKFIGGFGGDGNNITAFGESAGSISLVCHLCSDVPLFRRAILQSGVPFAVVDVAVKDAVYHALLAEFEIKEDTPAARLAALRAIPAEALAHSKTTGLDVMLCVPPKSSFFSRGVPSYTNSIALVASCPWVEEVVVGDDHFEGHAFMDFLRDTDAVKFVNTVVSVFGKENGRELLAAYDIDESTDTNLMWMNASILIGDMFLSEPMLRLADEITEHGGPKKVYRYSFGLSNPFPGGPAFCIPGHHYVEILFIFLTLCDRYPKHHDRFFLRQAHETARRWIRFGNGVAPWVAYTSGEGGVVAVCDDRSGWEERTRQEDERVSSGDVWGGRRYRGMEIMRRAFAGLEKLSRDGRDGVDLANQARLAMVSVDRYKGPSTR